MNKETIGFAFLFIIILALQVLIFNHITLFNVAVPIIFVYFIFKLPINTGNATLFTTSFLLGLCVDMFADTPGVNSLACTIISALKKPVFYAYVPRDDKSKATTPSISSLGITTYSKYLITLLGIYCFLAFTIEFFNFSDIKEIAVMSVSSTLISFIIILSMDSLNITGNSRKF